MAAAVIGVGGLQYYWIKEAIRLKQEEFDTSVFAAINRIAERLEDAEQMQTNLQAFQLDSTSSVTPLSIQEEFKLSRQTPFFNVGVEVKKSYHKTGTLISNKDNCQCVDCKEKRQKKYENQLQYIEKMLTQNLLTPKKLVDRLNLSSLDEYIGKEFKNRGINLDYKYGIFANEDESFVIQDGHYVVADNSSHEIENGWRTLFNTPYKVDLFQKIDLASPGQLMIQFPSQNTLMYGSVFWPLLLSVLFTVIIMGCFYYTILTIFHQKKLSEMKTDFINNMTHEFKTPIATISLAADSISSPMISGAPEKVKRFANIIRQENKRMNAQVEKVLQMAIVDKREFQLNLTDIDLHQVIVQAVAHANLQAEQRGGLVSAELSARTPQIQGDITHVSNIIANLLDNANKYSPDQPKIVVSTRNVSGGVQVIVKDHGVGMNKEALKHIFDKFYRVHTGNLHDVKGFGLGLSYVKALMTAHKGQIDVKSELGKGSSFILFFPYQVEN